MKKFTEIEEEFLRSMEEARIATSHDDTPHVKPVSFIYHEGVIFIATDYHTRTFKNIKKNPRVAISIDIYELGKHKAIIIQGKTTVLEKGNEFLDVYKLFEKRFAWVRNDPWKEEEAPFLKIVPNNITGWGLKK